MERVLADQGIHVETATTDDDGPGCRMSSPKIVLLEGNEKIRRRYFRKNTEFYKCSWSFGRWILQRVRDYDLVQVHALFSFTSVIAALAARAAGVPYVVRPLGTLEDYGLRNRRPLLKKLSLYCLEGPIIRHAAAVHFTSTAEQQQAEALGYPIRSAVIPLALNSLDLPPAPSLDALLPETTGSRIVLFLSRLDPKKNVEGLVHAFSKVAREVPMLHLVIAGSGEGAYVGTLKQQAARLGIASRISWPGYVDGDLKAALFQGATVFVLPSYSENFGIAVAEALAASLPCIVGRGVALARQIEAAEAGLCVGTGPADIAAGLRQVFLSEERRAVMARNARALAVAQFSGAVMGQRMRALYESILINRKEVRG